MAINQYTVIENGKERRPDIVAFLNGIPFVVIELKNATNEEVDIVDGFNQLQTYKRDIPSLFYYNAFMITSDGINAKVGTITSDLDRFMFWRTIDGEKESGLSFPQLQVMLYGMMNKKRFLDIVSKYISILSDEFLEEVKGLPQKNLALELLRRLLDGKIKAIAKKNVVQAKKFSEMLEASVIQYEKRSLETVEVIKALVDMAKDMNELHKRGEKLGLSDDELAFYDAISSNESARDFYENDVLKQIAKELTISIKNNIKVDWDVRESVRAQMRITVKRLLRKYKYPPDKQELR